MGSHFSELWWNCLVCLWGIIKLRYSTIRNSFWAVFLHESILSSTTCLCLKCINLKGSKTVWTSEDCCASTDSSLTWSTCSVLKGWTTYESLLLSSSCFLHFLFWASGCVSEGWRRYFVSLHFSELQEKRWPEIKVFWSGDEILHVPECSWTTFCQQVDKTRTRMCLSFSVNDWNKKKHRNVTALHSDCGWERTE